MSKIHYYTVNNFPAEKNILYGKCICTTIKQSTNINYKPSQDYANDPVIRVSQYLDNSCSILGKKHILVEDDK